MKRTDDQGSLLPHRRWLDTHCPRRPVSSGSKVGQGLAGIKRHGPLAAGRQQGEPWVNRKTRESEDKERLWLEGRYLSQNDSDAVTWLSTTVRVTEVDEKSATTHRPTPGPSR